ncbi:MAG: efflux RND transporter periplasmic adaptor subunit [Patescibacteria group bacterium]
MLQKIRKVIWRHKIISVIVLIIIIVGGYFAYTKIAGSATQTSYVLGAVTRGTIVSTVSGTGQVSASNQVDIKPNVSGNITKIFVIDGQQVKAGDLLMQFDSTDAITAVRNAQANLASAELNLAKLKRGLLPNQITNYQLQIDSATASLADAENNLTVVSAKAQTDLNNAYDDAQNAIQSSYNTASDILNRQVFAMFTDDNINNSQMTFLSSNSQAQIQTNYQRQQANTAIKEIKGILDNYPSDNSQRDAAIVQVKNKLDVVKIFLASLGDAVDSAIVSGSVTASTISSYKQSVSSAESSVLSTINSLNTQTRTLATQKVTNSNNLLAAQTKITNAQNSLAQAQNNYALQTAPPDTLSLQTQEISVSQARSSLANAQSKLADYSIKAPFDGIVTNVVAASGYSASNNTVLATVITQQQIADITLNEVDAAKVKVGQKATLTFDAVDDLEITGKLVQMDTIGTVSQGVVSYGAKIALDTQDDRIKPGMSVTAIIIIDQKIDVLTLNSSAIKTATDGSSYVQVLSGVASSTPTTASGGAISETPPQRVVVTVGLSDDTNTEITSGLSEGDPVIVKTVVSTVSSGSASTPSLLQSLGVGGRKSSNNSSQSNTTKSNSGSGGGMSGPPPGM